MNKRKKSLDILINVLENGRNLDYELENILEDRAFITKIVKGTIENKIYIDKHIECVSKTKISKMKTYIKNAIRLAVYEIFFMNTENAVVCNEIVKLVKKRYYNLSSFTNATIRQIIRNGKIELEKDNIENISIYYSTPIFIIKEYLKFYTLNETLEILDSNKEVSRITLFSKSNCIKDAVNMEYNDFLLNNDFDCVKIREVDAFVLKKYDFSNKDFYVQNISSMLFSKIPIFNKQQVVLDICAAPGGKSISISDKVNKIVANDINKYRLSLMKENISNLEIKNVEFSNYDASDLIDCFIEKFDVVIADLPCSALGLLRRKVDIINIDQEKILKINRLQKKILKNIYHYLKKGGIIIFSTCTITELENEKNVEYLETLGFEKYCINTDVFDKFSNINIKDNNVRIKSNFIMDGFFISVLRKK